MRNFFSIETQRRRRKTDENKIHVVSARGGYDGDIVFCCRQIGTPAEVILISVIYLCLGLFLLGIWPAIALMDSRPGLLRMYVHKSIRILPDPEKQEKQEL